MYIDNETVKKFLTFITKGHNDKCFWELRSITGDKKCISKFSKLFSDADSLNDFVAENQEELKEINCYIGINPRFDKARGDKNVKFGNTLIVDLDCPKSIEDAIKICEKLRSMHLDPSLVGNSGHGIHIFLKLSEIIDSDKWVELQEALISFFQKNFGEYKPDKKIKNPERVVRLLGTVNVKEDPVPTSIITESALTYTVGEIEKILSSADQNETRHESLPIILPEAKPRTDSQKKLRELRIQEMLNNERPEFKSLGQGIHSGVFYFGTKIYDEKLVPHDAVVTSDKNIYVDWGEDDNEIIQSFGLNYQYEFIYSILDNTWSNESIKEWLYGNPKEITLKELYDKIVSLLKIYMEYEDERWYSFIALDIISTYFNEAFDAIGRTLIKGDRGSGKTKQCQIYRQISFNPMMGTDWTKSSIFRAIESTKGTPIIDNFDEVSEDLLRDILVIFRAYKRGLKSVRTEGEKKRVPTGFNLLCKMVLNNISGLDSVSEDRSNIITLVKSKNIDITNRRINFDDPLWKEIRDSLFISALQNWKNVKEIYDTLKQKRLVGREAEIIEPILSLSKLIDEDLFKSMIDFELEKLGQKRINELSGDWIYNAMKVIITLLGDKQEKEIKLTEITDETADKLFDFGRKDEGQKRRLSIILGKKFKNHPYFKGRMMNGSAYYTFKKENVIKFCRLMDYEDLVDSVGNVGGKDEQRQL